MESILRLGVDGTAAKRGTDEAKQGLEGVSREAGRAVTALDRVTGMLKLLAGAWATYKIIDFIRQSALLQARYETLGVVLYQVGRNAGYTANEMDSFAKAVERSGITMNESRQSVTRMAQAQLDLTKSAQLARVAQDAAVIGGINSTEAFERLVHGIQAGQTEVLRTIGIQISMDQAYEKFARTLKINRDQLTESQKAQARMNEVLDYGVRIQGTYEAAMGTAGKQLTSMYRYTEDLKTKIGEVFNEGLVTIVMGWTEQMTKANKELDEMSRNNSLKQWGEELVDIFAQLADSIDAILNAAKQAGAWLAREGQRGEVRDWYSAERKRIAPGGAANFTDLAKLRELERERDRRLAALDLTYGESTDAIWRGQGRFGRAVQSRRAAVATDSAERAVQRQEEMREKAMAGLAGVRWGPAPAGKTDSSTVLKQREEMLRKLGLEASEAEARFRGASDMDLKEASILAEAKKAGLGKGAVQSYITRLRQADLQTRERTSYIEEYKQRQEAEDELAKAIAERQNQEGQAYVQTHEAMQRRLGDIQFESSLIGKSAKEQEKLRALRQIDLQIQDTAKDKTWEMQQRLQSLGETIKSQLVTAYDEMHAKQTNWINGAKDALQAYQDKVKDSASAVRGAWGQGLQNLEDMSVQFFRKGKLDWSNFIDHIINEYIRLTTVRPLISAAIPFIEGLFGLGGGGGGGGMAGAGDVLSTTTTGFASRGGVFGPRGAMNLRRYAGGGVAYGPQMAMFGEGGRPEAYVPLPDGRNIPVKFDGGQQGLNIKINIMEGAPNAKARVNTSQQNGELQIDVLIEQVEDAIGSNIRQGRGSLSTAMEEQYGLSRTPGAMR